MFARRRCSSRPVGLGKKVARRGVASVEGAFALSALFLLLFGLFDMGIGVLRHNMLSIAAHAIARAAVVRGSTTSADKTSLGPQTYNGHLADGSILAQAANGYLATMPLAQVSMNVTWPDGGNSSGHRVSVLLKYSHEPITPLLSAIGTLNLQGKATLRMEE
jgi:Flp pilus assembly protein TadG